MNSNLPSIVKKKGTRETVEVREWSQTTLQATAGMLYLCLDVRYFDGSIESPG